MTATRSLWATRAGRTLRELSDYYRRTIDLAVTGRRPTTSEEFLTWSFIAPLRLWNQECRHEGHTFADYYLGHLEAMPLQSVLRTRPAYATTVALWPLLAAVAAAGRNDPWQQWHAGMRRPDARLRFPDRELTDTELTSIRPDLSLAVFYADEWARYAPAYHRLDDKNVFVAACKGIGLPTPRTYTRGEVPADATLVIKDPREDQGRGVRVLTSEQIAALPTDVAWQIQDRLINHPDLQRLLPAGAPLSTLRVVTVRPPTGEPAVAMTSWRMGMAGELVDNRPGRRIIAAVDPETGRIGHAEAPGPAGAPLLTRHPQSEYDFTGEFLPDWQRIREVCESAHRELTPNAPTVGWDIAVTPDGPLLIELNLAAGYSCKEFDDDRLTPATEAVLARWTESSGATAA